MGIHDRTSDTTCIFLNIGIGIVVGIDIGLDLGLKRVYKINDIGIGFTKVFNFYDFPILEQLIRPMDDECKKKMFARVIWEYEAENKQELSVIKGEYVEV